MENVEFSDEYFDELLDSMTDEEYQVLCQAESPLAKAFNLWMAKQLRQIRKERFGGDFQGWINFILSAKERK